MEKSRLEQIIKALNTKGVTRPCPRCNNPRFEIVGEAIVPLNDQPGITVVGGPAIPVVLVACSNCGYLTQHAQGPLNLMKGQQ
jgi:hypothetical protein